MKLWARLTGGTQPVIADLQHAQTNPYHAATSSVDMTGMEGFVRVGQPVHPNGNPISGAATLGGLDLARNMLPAELDHQLLRGVWIDETHYDTHHEALAKLAVLAQVGSSWVADSSGAPSNVDAGAVMAKAGEYMEACYQHAADLLEQLDAAEAGSTVDVTQGWPDNGKPADAEETPAQPVEVAQPDQHDGASGTAATGPATNVTGVQSDLGTMPNMVADGTNQTGGMGPHGEAVEGTIDGRQAEDAAPAQAGDVRGTNAGEAE